MTTLPTELRAIKVVDLTGGQFNCQLYFYTKEDQKVYRLKNKSMEGRLRVMGSCRDIHLNGDDLIEKGLMQQFQSEYFHIYYL
jgi:hypothetical protein